MIAVQSQTETRRGGPVPGLDQPCSRNPTAALPLVGSDPYVPCTPCGERGATGWLPVDSQSSLHGRVAVSAWRG